MVATADLAALPVAPNNPLPYWRRVRAMREIHVGCEKLRDAGGPVSLVKLGPARVMAQIVVTTSPQGARDVLGRTSPVVDRDFPVLKEMRRLSGDSLFTFTQDAWLPRRRVLQPVFTKNRVAQFGGQMAEAANEIAQSWHDGAEVDLDSECRKLTIRVLCRSVFGLDLDERADALAMPLREAMTYLANRGLSPLRAPAWLPTPARHRARAAIAMFLHLAEEILHRCRTDPAREAPLVRALLAATDPDTGLPLSDDDICRELIVFLAAGHDTTATTLTYALWALGRHPEMQDQVAAEVTELGDRSLTPDDPPRLGYTVQVLNEALRLGGPTPATMRVALQDLEVDGYRVEAGSLITVGIYAMHRDPLLWEDPLLFNPDRFSPERSKRRDRWQFLPFGGGPRSCIGDHFAMLEATLGLATIVRQCQIHSLDDSFPTRMPLTIVADGVIRARVNARHRRERRLSSRR
jgi:cytochrome P450